MISQPSSCAGCPLYGVGKGFVLGAGDPLKAKYAVVLEAPGRDEISFELKPNPHRAFLQTKEECAREYATRKRDYPQLEERFLRTGLPVVGQTGLALQFWIWPKVGIKREECFIDNTIRCLPPKGKTSSYPIGEAKKAAEKHCRQYDRLAAYRPDTLVFSLHPAGLLREITPLPLAIKDFEKVRDFTGQGRRVLALLGGKATSAFARYGSNVTRWRGHYQALVADWCQTYKSLFEYRAKGRRKVMKVDEDNLFGVPETILRKAQERTERPTQLLPGPCKNVNRYKGKRPPKCGCMVCWDKYEKINLEVLNVSNR